MTRKIGGATRTTALAALLAGAAAIGLTAAPVRAMQILEAADHGELSAEISATGVSRIALGGDRVRRVVRAPGGFAVEHDPESGDLYLRPVAPAHGPEAAHDPVTLFIGTERGFTYRLILTPAMRDSAQILIRNADAAPAALAAGAAQAGDPRIGVRGRPRVAALVRLVRAVARRELLAGYEIVAAGGETRAGLAVIETWRGPRFAAHVVEAGTGPGAGAGPDAGTDTPDAAALAGTMLDGEDGARVAAVWLAPAGTGPSGGRLAVLVTEAVPGPAAAGEAR